MLQVSRMGFAVKEYDLAIIGGGPGGKFFFANFSGYVAAIKAGQKGLKTVCIEKRGALGGTCLNVGCIPSKALLNATHKLHEAQHKFKDLGIITGNVSCDFPKLMAGKDKSVTGLTGGIEFLLKKNKVDYIKGWGKFSGENNVDIDLNAGGTETIKAKNVIIATGSEPNSLPASTGLSTDERWVVSSTGALSLPEVPKRMIVIGGGVIGLELGSVYQRLGTEVTVVQHTDRICPFLDEEVGKAFQNVLKKQGVKFMCNTKVVSGINSKEKGVKVNLESTKDGTKTTVDADVVLVSIGRHAFTGGLQLEKAGLKADERGVVQVNGHW